MSNQRIATTNKRFPQLSGAYLRWRASVARYGFEKLSSRRRKCA